MTKERKLLGALGERLAASHLEKRGYKILDMNYRCCMGEVDIIAYDGKTYIFVEVKTRSGLAFGRPIESINYKKREHMVRTALNYLKAKQLGDCSYRFDAVEVLFEGENLSEIHHVKNIV
ncbi:YraN family protein [Geosporobacter ferrireducens]|uniref:YraN family protein n=1 Tax=Geosporobacter ferrireducens TaxID=1424294 RepID=UPI00139D6614|nr:YraN family protein [Geosporobacter ferrireducens]MTI53824.1 YraN family protein [Geosporobacter ferrireducens]